MQSLRGCVAPFRRRGCGCRRTAVRTVCELCRRPAFDRRPHLPPYASLKQKHQASCAWKRPAPIATVLTLVGTAPACCCQPASRAHTVGVRLAPSYSDSGLVGAAACGCAANLKSWRASKSRALVQCMRCRAACQDHPGRLHTALLEMGQASARHNCQEALRGPPWPPQTQNAGSLQNSASAGTHQRPPCPFTLSRPPPHPRPPRTPQA